MMESAMFFDKSRPYFTMGSWVSGAVEDAWFKAFVLTRATLFVGADSTIAKVSRRNAMKDVEVILREIRLKIWGKK